MFTLSQALDLMRQAKDQGLTLRLWGSLAVEWHSPSAGRVGINDAHDDVDFAAKAGQRQELLDFFGSLGYGREQWRNFGPFGSGWVTLWNEKQEAVELAMTYLLDDPLLQRSVVTLPLEWLTVRALMRRTELWGDFKPRSRVAAALLLDHDLVESATSEDQIDLQKLRPLLSLYPHKVLEHLPLIREAVQGIGFAFDRSTVLSRLGNLEREAKLALPRIGHFETFWIFMLLGWAPLWTTGPHESRLRAQLLHRLKANGELDGLVDA